VEKIENRYIQRNWKEW